MAGNHPFEARQAVTILDSITDGVFTVDGNFVVTFFNKAAEKITGVPVDEALGCPCCEVFRADICEGECALRRTIDTGTPVVNQHVHIVRADGRRMPISVSTALLRDRTGRIVGGVETFRDLSVVETLRKEMKRRHTFYDIVSRSHSMHELFAILPEVAQSDSIVLIQGESGTGKELLARALHSLSPRRDNPMVTVNSAALPDTLLESELFGYRAGAFTDAKKDKPGRFAQADGGTLFLDEIADISPALQVRLLRVLQNGEYEPLGSLAPVRANVRVITATNKDLEEEVAAGRFRSDLFYRINVVTLKLPPLRERREDIPLLASHIIERLNRLRGREVAGVSDEALRLLMQYDWPGNIRELENAIEFSFILCRDGYVKIHHLPERLRPAGLGFTPAETPGTLADIEARAIYNALSRHGWKRVAAARELGINKTTLWRKLKRLGLTEPDFS